MHVYFCFSDHFEPFWEDADRETAFKRVAAWCSRYPEIAKNHRDSDGRYPIHTFYYPIEEYDPVILERIAGLCRAGIADVEVHLHHDNDTAGGLRNKLLGFKKVLRERHSLLRVDPDTEEVQYGFIHGNWALNNSRKDGRYCGVNNELAVLKGSGCYADFTLPSAPSETQTRKINSIYFAKFYPAVPKSHDEGRDVCVGEWSEEDLLIMQGPLCLNWKSRKYGIFPRIENSEVSSDNPATDHRIDLWVKCGIHVKGAPDTVFIKVYTHGAQEQNSSLLLGGNLEKMWDSLERRYNDGTNYILHYVSCWEMYKVIREIAKRK